MDDYKERVEKSLSRWAQLDKISAILEKEKKKQQMVDNLLISEFCAANDPNDVKHIIKKLNGHGGLPEHDKNTISNFEKLYPEKLTIRAILSFKDVTDIYSEFLRNYGGEEQ